MEVEPQLRAPDDHAAQVTPDRDPGESAPDTPVILDKFVVNSITAAGWRIEPMGDGCLVVEFGQRVDAEINRTARSVADYMLAHPIEGVVDIVPAFTSVTVHYRPEAFSDPSMHDPPHRQLRRQIEAILVRGVARPSDVARLVEVPVCYGGDFGPDLAEVAAACGLTPEQVIELHGASPHVVYMLGFAPGFPYLGGLDPRLAMPRRATPRTKIPAGTVAIAREQTAIYSLETPGGWNLIGRTPLKLFTPQANPPCLLQLGDRVCFVSIPLELFRTLEAQQA
jgi:inhibitor of KinA